MKARVSGDRHRGANEGKVNRCSPSRTHLTLGGGACMGEGEESAEGENRLRARKDFFLSLDRSSASSLACGKAGSQTMHKWPRGGGRPA